MLEVDLERRRIALTARKGASAPGPETRGPLPAQKGPARQPQPKGAGGGAPRQAAFTNNPFAALLGKTAYSVREWCRYGRVRAEKRACGRGTSQEWVITHEELTRLRNEGLLPLSGK